jgi:rubrerythrin
MGGGGIEVSCAILFRKKIKKDRSKGGIPMPEFATPFAGLAHERKLTREELVRAIRYFIAAEYEAIQLYTQLAESIDDELAIEVLKDIADEERVHAGEFLRLLKHLAPHEEKYYEEGAEEVEEMMKTTGDKGKESPVEDTGEETGEDLPFCTSAADPEHSRAYREDEPCDDATAGNIEKGHM